MAIPDSSKQAASDAVAARGRWISVHTTGGGGTTGANEASGGTYARKETSWTANGSGMNAGVSVPIDVPNGTYTEGGVWSAQTAGTFVGSGVFTNGQIVVSGSGGTINVSATIAIT